MANGVTSPGAAVAIGLYGDAVRVSSGSQGGWHAASVDSVESVLGERAEEEVAATLQRLPKGTQQIGFTRTARSRPPSSVAAAIATTRR